MQHNKRQLEDCETNASSKEVVSKDKMLEELRAASVGNPAAQALLRSIMKFHTNRKQAHESLQSKYDRLETKVDSIVADNARLECANRSLLEKVNLQEEMKAMALQKAHGAMLMVNPTRGEVVFCNDAAEELFGPSVGMNVFALFLNTLMPFAEAPTTEDSVVGELPVRYGVMLWKEMHAHESRVQERVLLKTAMHTNPVDTSLVMKFIRDGNDHPWIIIEALELEKLNTDAMTGLFRREVAISAMKRELAHRGSEKQSPVSVIMMDIDDFKMFNSLYSYEGGNRVIRRIAGVINSEIRSRDLACRWFSGDEFLVVVYSGLSVACMVAERISQHVKSLSITMTDAQSGKENDVKIGLSIGCAEYEKGDDWVMLTNRAESQLQNAKNEGKGCVSASFNSVGIE